MTAIDKSWWECATAIAWLVAGDGARAGHPGDGSTTNQHMKIFDLSDPSHPHYIRDIGLLGQNPGSAVHMATSGVHGPYIGLANPLTGEVIKRAYLPYGTSSNGVLQVVDRNKVLPNNYVAVAGQAVGGSWMPATSNSAVRVPEILTHFVPEILPTLA